MKKILTFLMFFIIISSCNEDSLENNTQGGTPSYYLNVTINGQNYSNNQTGFLGFSNKIGCTSQPFYLGSISQINVANYFFDVYLFQLRNNADFSIINPSNGGVYEYNDYWANGSQNYCNFDLMVTLEDKQQSVQTSTLSTQGSNHIVTSINQVGQTSTKVTYSIEGNFSCSFVNSAGAVIPVTGNYRIPVDCLL